MGLFYEPGDGSSLKVTDSDWSIEESVVAIEPDLYPPIPDPALHATGSPFEIFVATEGVFFHVVTAVQAEDVINGAGDLLPANENVEYKFVCSNSYFSSGNDGDPDGIEWRSLENLVDDDGLPLTYPNGDLQVPEQYWARRGLQGQNDEWYIIVRDMTPNNNTAEQSESRTISTPAP
jgi:hypothetical protein